MMDVLTTLLWYASHNILHNVICQIGLNVTEEKRCQLPHSPFKKKKKVEELNLYV